MLILIALILALLAATQLFFGLAILRLAREMQQWQRQPVVLPDSLPVIATLPAMAMRGGAIRFELDNGTRSILDCGDSDGLFAGEIGTEMVVTFQRVIR